MTTRLMIAIAILTSLSGCDIFQPKYVQNGVVDLNNQYYEHRIYNEAFPCKAKEHENRWYAKCGTALFAIVPNGDDGWFEIFTLNGKSQSHYGVFNRAPNRWPTPMDLPPILATFE